MQSPAPKPTQPSPPAKLDFNKPLPPGMVGIGLKLVFEAQAICVQAVLAGGTAAAAKMVAGDRIIAVDGTAVATVGAEKVWTKIPGAAGTKVSLTLQRNGSLITLVVERAAIVAKKKLSLDFSDMSEVLERKISP